MSLSIIADLVGADARIQPDGRRAAVAATLRQQAEECESHCRDVGTRVPTPGEMLAACVCLSRPSPDDDTRAVARRKTMTEIVRAINGRSGIGFDVCDPAMPGDPAAVAALPWFDATVSAFAASDDPRQRAMAETAAREAAELAGGLTVDLGDGSGPRRSGWAS